MAKEVKLVKDLLNHQSFNHLKSYLNNNYKNFEYFEGFGRFEESSEQNSSIKNYADEVLDKAKEIFGSDTLKFTYGLIVHYEGEDAKLHKHKDTNACTYTLDVCLYQNVQWPLIVEDQEYNLEENEALAFYGEEQDHWREDFPVRSWNRVGMLFLHFAEPDHWFFEKKL